MTPIWKDPYYIIDPTVPHSGIAIQGRSAGGRFTHKSILATMADDNFPLNSKYWGMYARGVIEKVVNLRGVKFAYKIIPQKYLKKKYFSLRMTCEMFEFARDALMTGKTDAEAIQAAHDYLAKKQLEIGLAKLEEIGGEGLKHNQALDLGEVLLKVCSGKAGVK